MCPDLAWLAFPDFNLGSKDSTKMLNDFQNFVTTEKERLKERKKTLVKQEMNSRMADLVKFSQSFKVCIFPPVPHASSLIWKIVLFVTVLSYLAL